MLSRLNSATVIWSPKYTIFINRLQFIQNKLLKFISYKNDAGNLLCIIDLINRRIISDVITFYKTISSITQSSKILYQVGIQLILFFCNGKNRFLDLIRKVCFPLKSHGNRIYQLNKNKKNNINRLNTGLKISFFLFLKLNKTETVNILTPKKVYLVTWGIKKYTLFKSQFNRIIFVGEKKNKKPKKRGFAFFSGNCEVRVKMNSTKV